MLNAHDWELKKKQMEDQRLNLQMRVNSYSSSRRDLTHTTPLETFNQDKIGQIIQNVPEEIFKNRAVDDTKNMRSLTLGSQRSTASLGGSEMHHMDAMDSLREND